MQRLMNVIRFGLTVWLVVVLLPLSLPLILALRQFAVLACLFDPERYRRWEAEREARRQAKRQARIDAYSLEQERYENIRHGNLTPGR